MYAKVSVALTGVEGVIIFTSITEVRIILLLDINTMCFALVMFNNHREKTVWQRNEKHDRIRLFQLTALNLLFVYHNLKISAKNSFQLSLYKYFPFVVQLNDFVLSANHNPIFFSWILSFYGSSFFFDLFN